MLITHCPVRLVSFEGIRSDALSQTMCVLLGERKKALLCLMCNTSINTLRFNKLLASGAYLICTWPDPMCSITVAFPRIEKKKKNHFTHLETAAVLEASQSVQLERGVSNRNHEKGPVTRKCKNKEIKNSELSISGLKISQATVLLKARGAASVLSYSMVKT